MIQPYDAAIETAHRLIQNVRSQHPETCTPRSFNALQKIAIAALDGSIVLSEQLNMSEERLDAQDVVIADLRSEVTHAG